MFPLMALGSGLGQFAQDYRQQQESALRQQIQQQAIREYMQKQQDENLLGAAALGGKIPGFGGGLNLPGARMQQPQQSQMPMLPPAAAPQAAALPPGMMRTETGQMVPQGDYLTAEQDTGPPSRPAPLMSPVPGAGGGVIPLDAPEEAPAATSETGRDGVTVNTAYTPLDGGTPASAGAAAPDTSSEIATPDEFSQLLSMFHQTDPSAIAQHIKQVRPDADEGSVWRATATLMKMASGNVREQLGAASLMKFLVGEQGRTQRAGAAEAGRMARANISSADRAASRDVRVRGQDISSADRASGRATTERGQDIRRDTAEAREAGVQGRFKERISEQRYQRALARADGQTKLALSEMHRQMGDLRNRISIIDNGMNTNSPENKKLRDSLAKQYDDLVERERNRATAVLGDETKE